MPIYFDQYQTAASGIVRGLLHGDNNVCDCAGYISGSDEHFCFATDSGVCAISRDGSAVSTALGWLDQSDINGIALTDDYLYVAHGQVGVGGDIGRIALCELFAEVSIESLLLPSGSPVSVEATGHGLFTGDEVRFALVGGSLELNGNVYTITVTDSDNFTLDGTDGDDFTPYGGGGKFAYRKSAAYDSDFGSTSDAMLDSTKENAVVSIDSAEIDGDWYLAYLASVGSNDADPVKVYVYQEGAGWFSKGNNHTEKVAISDDGLLYAATGSMVEYIAGADSIAGNEWAWDGFFGNCDTSFGGTEVPEMWKRLYKPSANFVETLSVSGGKLTRAATISADSSQTSFRYPAFASGDFDFQLDGLFGADPTLTGTMVVTKGITVESLENASHSATLIWKRFYNSGSAQENGQFSGTITVSNSAVSSGTDSTGTAKPPTTGDGWKMRIRRNGDKLSLYFDRDDGNGWAENCSYTGFPDDDVLLKVFLRYENCSGETGSWEIQALTNADPWTMQSAFPAAQIADVSAVGAAFGLAYEEAGAAAVLLNSTTPASSSVSWFGASGSGADFEILSSDNCTSIAIAAGINPISALWVATADSGIDFLQVTPGASYDAINVNIDRGKTLSDRIDCLAIVGSIIYGCGAAAAVSGGGYLDEAGFSPPEDTEIIAHGWLTSSGTVNVALSWGEPTDSDFSHSLLYRRINDGSWYYLTDADNWAAAGDILEIESDENGGTLCHTDVSVADGKYEYKVLQVNEGGFESNGAVIVEYIDEPVVSLSIQSGLSVSYTSNLLLSISGDSGDDSGNAPDCVHEITLRESTQPWASAVVYRPVGVGPWEIPFRLSSGAGLKTIEAKGRDRAGQEGESDSVSITYSPSIQTTPTLEQNLMIGYRIRSDDAPSAWKCEQSETDFTAANVADARLAKVWKGGSVSEAGLTREYMLTHTFGQTETVEIFFMKNYNLASLTATNVILTLCADDGPFSGGVNWTPAQWRSNAAYTIELGNLVGRSTVLHRPQVTYRYWALVAIITVGNFALASLTFPTIGRIGLVRSTDVWQPQANVDFDVQISQRDNSVLLETENQVFETCIREQRKEYRLGFSRFSRETADFRTAQDVFSALGKSGDLIALLRPSEFRTGTDTPSSSDEWTFDPVYGQIIEDLTLRFGQAGRASFDLAIREIVGGEEEA